MNGLGARLSLLEARLAVLERMDARRREAPGQLALDLGGKGKACGQGWINAKKTCRIGQGPATRKPQSKPAGGITIDAEKGEPRFGGLKPTRSLGSGAFGKTYQFDTDQGPVVVKVNGLTMGDPLESDPRVGLAQQRENVARRELRNLQRAHAAGLGPEPIGDLVHLPDGRWSFAYRMLPGSKLTPSHQTLDLTPEAAATLADPKAAARYVAGALQLARRQADSGLIHGDLHGGNILVGPDGTPSLIDWAMTRESRNPWNQSERSAAQRAMDESYALMPLIQFSGQLDVAIEQDRILSTYSRQAEKAEKAYKAVIDAHDLAWEEANPDKVAVKFEKGEFHRRMVEANRLKREEGVPYDMALRDPRVGLEPPLTPDVLALAAAKRDEVFGQSDLDEMRRELDRRFGRQA